MSTQVPILRVGVYLIFQQCGEQWFTCYQGYINCISDEFKCDCTADCEDESDENITWAHCEPNLATLCSSAGMNRELNQAGLCVHPNAYTV